MLVLGPTGDDQILIFVNKYHNEDLPIKSLKPSIWGAALPKPAAGAQRESSKPSLRWGEPLVSSGASSGTESAVGKGLLVLMGCHSPPPKEASEWLGSWSLAPCFVLSQGAQPGPHSAWPCGLPYCFLPFLRLTYREGREGAWVRVVKCPILLVHEDGIIIKQEGAKKQCEMFLNVC